ncbi:putative TOS1-like glycosyl hydrolase-domain-containing protein [Elsinoe ampelina]|uniref:glucan endo-1,3-beta-D-glucosidase n=1 Tax=Elsinoe ampelina TaxID=302913 RepID=A0A6A6G682_9PEZI|nr:putative TOS1-like glycosyl hydrolase-domain-containing protein [Elsinoe ampelina]
MDSRGNNYRNAVKGMTFDNVGGSGTYNRITYMDPATAQCSSEPFKYSGPLGPMGDDVSIHVRGPTQLLKFAAYSAQAPKKAKREESHLKRHRRHAHGKRHQQHQKRACGDIVTATYPDNGAVFSFTWTDGCAPGAAQTPAPAAPANEPAPAPAAATPEAKVQSAPAVDNNFISGSWSRVGYYDADAQKKEGITFLNNKGADGISGSWSMALGNSLSYAAADGCSPAKEDTILAKTTIPSVEEFSIWSSEKCGANGGDCGYYRPDTVAHKGFSGVQKAFVFEFQMPHGPNNGGMADDLPALWILNAQNPRTTQYGPAQCKCWNSCGEIDIFETLAPGENRAIAAIHGNAGFRGGNVDYFDRPTDAPIIFAAVLMDNKVHLKVLDSFDFGAGSGPAMVDLVRSSTSTAGNGVSIASVY